MSYRELGIPEVPEQLRPAQPKALSFMKDWVRCIYRIEMAKRSAEPRPKMVLVVHHEGCEPDDPNIDLVEVHSETEVHYRRRRHDL